MCHMLHTVSAILFIHELINGGLMGPGNNQLGMVEAAGDGLAENPLSIFQCVQSSNCNAMQCNAKHAALLLLCHASSAPKTIF